MSQVQVEKSSSSSLALAELEKIVQLFSTQELPNIVAKCLIDSPMKPSSAWSLGNQILMLIHGTEDARGFRQWQEVSRFVKKGSRAFYILGPLIIKKKTIDEVTKEQKESPMLVGFKGIPVFRFEDTDGQDLPIYQPREVPPLLDVAAKWGLKIQYERCFGEWGHYNDQKKEIVLGTEAWDTFFHELAHAGHAKIDNFNLLTMQHEGEVESIAHLTSAVLSRMYGRNNDGYSWNAIGKYAGEKKPEAVGRMCIRILGKVKKIISLIFEAKEEQEQIPA